MCKAFANVSALCACESAGASANAANNAMTNPSFLMAASSRAKVLYDNFSKTAGQAQQVMGKQRPDFRGRNGRSCKLRQNTSNRLVGLAIKKSHGSCAIREWAGWCQGRRQGRIPRSVEGRRGESPARREVNMAPLLRWSTIVCVLVSALAVSAMPHLLLAQSFRAPPETMHIEEQPGYVPDPEAERLPAAYQRQAVFYRTTEVPGTVIVQTSERFLYVVQGNNRAIRYGIGVGREGFQWSGLLKISRKAEWPDWTPPPEMMRANPICRASWRVVPATRWGLVRSTLVTPYIAFTAPTSRRPSVNLFHPDASGWSIPT